jgi:hypothetical protein
MSGSLTFNTDVEKEWLVGLLRERDVTIVFTKKDGNERKMLCTLSESKIPTSFSTKITKKSENPESVAVFDLEKAGWRSFRFDSVKEIHWS